MTDAQKASHPLSPSLAPVFILLRPQMAENVGAAFRALWNCGLTSLRIVAPRDGWPHPKGIAAAAGAADHLHHVQVFDTLEAATKDLQFLLATTARHRDLVKPIYPLQDAIGRLRFQTQQGARGGILFGAERTGLTSDELAHAQAILTIPLNPLYASLNLAQAVLLVAHTWWDQHRTQEAPELPSAPSLSPYREALATHENLCGFLDHLERALDLSGFLHPPLMRAHMVRNMRALFGRIPLTAQEVRTLRGMLTSFERLATHPPRGVGEGPTA